MNGLSFDSGDSGETSCINDRYSSACDVDPGSRSMTPHFVWFDGLPPNAPQVLAPDNFEGLGDMESFRFFGGRYTGAFHSVKCGSLDTSGVLTLVPG